jgi:stage V sporulation protein B
MKTSLIKGTMLLSLSSLVMLFSGYAIHIGLGRFLGPDQYGDYGVVIALWSCVNLVLTTGLPQAVSQSIASNEKQSESVLKSALILQAIALVSITVVYYFMAEPLAKLLNDISLKPLIQLTAFIFPLNAIYSLFLGYYNGLHAFKKQAIIDIVYGLSKVIFILSLVFIFKLNGAIFGFIIAALCATLVSFHFPKNVDYYFSFKKLIIFSIPLIGFTIFLTLYQTLDLLFVKAFIHDGQAAGYYTASQNIAKIPLYVLSALAGIVFPSIAKNISEKREDKNKRLIQQSTRFILALLLPMVILLAATSYNLVSLLYSNEYLPAGSSLSVLVFGIGFLTIFTIQSNIISGAGLPWLAFVISGIGIAVTTITCIVLIPKFALQGAALGTTFGSFVATVLSSGFIYYRFNTLVPIKDVLKIILATCIVGFIAMVIPIPSLVLPIWYIILFAVYLFILWKCKEITSEDIALVKAVLPEKILKRLPL